MTPPHGSDGLRPLDDREAHATHVGSPQALRIDFVAVAAGQVSGTLEPYIAPDCECRVSTTFSGRILDGAIEGTFVTRGSAIADQHGRWRLRRD